MDKFKQINFLLGLIAIASFFMLQPLQTSAEVVGECSITIDANTHTYYSAAGSNGICAGHVYGYYVDGPNQYNIGGVVYSTIQSNGQQVKIEIPDIGEAVLTVYIVKKKEEVAETKPTKEPAKEEKSPVKEVKNTSEEQSSEQTVRSEPTVSKPKEKEQDNNSNDATYSEITSTQVASVQQPNTEQPELADETDEVEEVEEELVEEEEEEVTEEEKVRHNTTNIVASDPFEGSTGFRRAKEKLTYVVQMAGSDFEAISPTRKYISIGAIICIVLLFGWGTVKIYERKW